MYLGFYNFYARYNGNRMFDDPHAEIGDELVYPLVHFSKYLKEKGVRHDTIDMNALDQFDAVLFLDFPTWLNPRYLKLMARRHPRLYMLMFEGPAVRPDNWFKFNHKPFRKIFVWDTRWADGEKYIHYKFPIKLPPFAPYQPSRAEKLCCLIGSQKYSWHKNELYSERLRVIRWFSQNHPAEFDLFGTRWDRYFLKGRFSLLNPLVNKMYQHFPRLGKIKPVQSWRGKVKWKREVLPQYKFALTIENSAFPGGVTEKLFDTMIGGAVPVYLGDPEVEKMIPRDLFVDYRQFKNLEQLYLYLKSMPEVEYEAIRQRIHAFIHGEGIKPWGSQAFVEMMYRQIVEDHR